MSPAPHLEGSGPWRIGRGRTCEVQVEDAAVSREHAEFTRRGSTWFVSDLGSRHGTYVNSVRLDPEIPVTLSSGDTLRVGPCSFIVGRAGDPPSTIKSAPIRDAAFAPGTLIRRVTDADIDSAASRRLQLLIDGAESIYAAQNESELARIVTTMARKASGFPRAAFVRLDTGGEDPQVIATDPADAFDRAGFSHSLLREAASGEIVELTSTEEMNYGQSIGTLGISKAICAPLLIDGMPIAALYLDAREMEPQGEEDSVGFCHALARLTSLSLSEMRRADLANRQRLLEEELKAAHQAQSFLGPAERGEIGHVRYTVSWEPGQFVAGDFFDIFRIDEHRVGLCLGDVSGQGIRAAILMAALISHTRAALAENDDAARAVASVNRYAAEHTEPGMFASLFLGILDSRDNKMRVADAGHGHWFVRRRDGSITPAPPTGGLLVGIDADAPYTPSELDINAGDRIVIYSDGIIEVHGEDGSLFGQERLEAATANASSPDEDVRDGLDALRKFSAEEHPDDTTIASIELLA